MYNCIQERQTTNKGNKQMAQRKTIFKAMSKFLSKDATRGTLQGFYIETINEVETRITATNGHVLCSHKMDTEQFRFECVQEFRVPAPEELNDLIIYANPKTTPMDEQLYSPTGAHYPKYRNIIPLPHTMTDVDKLDFHISFDPKNVQIVIDAKKYFGMSHAEHAFDYATTKLGACLSYDAETEIIIMPIRRSN